MAKSKSHLLRKNSGKYHETDMKVGICRGLDLSRQEIADLTGVSLATVDLRKDEPFAQMVETFTKTAAATFRIETKEDLEKQFQKKWGKTMEVIDSALENEDLNLALKGVDRVLDRTLGKPTQKLESTSDHTERTILEIPEQTIRVLEAFAAAQKPRIEAPAEEADVIDVVATEG